MTLSVRTLFKILQACRQQSIDAIYYIMVYNTGYVANNGGARVEAEIDNLCRWPFLEYIIRDLELMP